MRLVLSFALLTAFLACGDDGSGSDVDAAVSDIDAAPVDAAPGSDPGEIICGEDICTSPDVCCGDLNAAVCTTAEACAADFSLECDDPGDCTTAGDACCLTEDGAACTVSGDCTGGQLCAVDDDCPGSTCSDLKFCVPTAR